MSDQGQELSLFAGRMEMIENTLYKGQSKSRLSINDELLKDGVAAVTNSIQNRFTHHEQVVTTISQQVGHNVAEISNVNQNMPYSLSIMLLTVLIDGTKSSAYSISCCC